MTVWGDYPYTKFQKLLCCSFFKSVVLVLYLVYTVVLLCEITREVVYGEPTCISLLKHKNCRKTRGKTNGILKYRAISCL